MHILSRVGLAALATIFVTGLTLAGPAAHPGGIDGHGCHHDTKAGGYHCHKGPLRGKSFRDKSEMLEAWRKLPNNKKLPQRVQKSPPKPAGSSTAPDPVAPPSATPQPSAP